MALAWDSIKKRAFEFTKRWEGTTDERAESQTFWNEFFTVFGVDRRRVAAFEKFVHKGEGKTGFIDLLWKGSLLIEQKSRGKDLDKAHTQAKDYFDGLKDKELPRFILVSDFDRFKLYDLDKNDEVVADFQLKDFPKQIKTFGFLAGYQIKEIKAEDPINIKAAEKMAQLHDSLKSIGYEGKDLEVYLVRLLFLLFAEDTGIFERNLFLDFLLDHTAEDGSDLAANLAQLFETLDTPKDKRLKNLPEHFALFEYVNGKLFAERLTMAGFDEQMRDQLIEASHLDWSGISPAIFGSLFQGVMDSEERRRLGAHYTSEPNILKLIDPLFLDDLKAEFKDCNNKKKLEKFHEKLGSLTFFDPACGCGNFLVTTYKELRLLELEVLKAIYKDQQVMGVEHLILINVDQFYGIEIDEFPAQIAQVAMWLTDHQMNLLVSEAFGEYFARLPLVTAPTIIHGNSLEIDWESVVPKKKLSYIMGNPPFVGAKFQNTEQKTDMKRVFSGVKSAGILDFVTAWYLKAAQYIQGTAIEVAFVSTNSITQGEQVGVLWGELLERWDIKINFAHRTFSWTSEARGKAAVHCVIVGFGLMDKKTKRLFEYEDIKGNPVEIKTRSINPYLIDGPLLALKNRSKPICNIPGIRIGNKPIDGGNYLFLPYEKDEFLAKEPAAKEFMFRWMGAEEYINGKERWVLWLGDCPPEKLRKMPLSMERIKAVRAIRLASKSEPTRKIAETPTRFHVENFPKSEYLLIPKVSSERRKFIPIGFLPPEVIASDLVFISREARLFDFGILSSTMHMAWMRFTAGRLKSDYRYSVGIVYNNYPWPNEPKETDVKAIEKAAQAVLDARKNHPGSTLADLYDPLTAPKDLLTAHKALDKAVDKAYGKASFKSELERIQFLFALYARYTKLGKI